MKYIALLLGFLISPAWAGIDICLELTGTDAAARSAITTIDLDEYLLSGSNFVTASHDVATHRYTPLSGNDILRVRFHSAAAEAKARTQIVAASSLPAGILEVECPAAIQWFGFLPSPSGAVSVVKNNQVISGAYIVSSANPAFSCSGFSGVTLKKSRIEHSAGSGANISGCPNFTMEDVEIIRTDVPSVGKHTIFGQNVTVSASNDFTATRVKVVGGSSGFYILNSARVVLSFIEGHDQRGPIPRGQLVQFDKSDDGILQDFSTENDRTKAWTEDNISIFNSKNTIVRRGLVDGNNSPSGVGVLAEGSLSSNILIEDVDAINQGNGAFSNVDIKKGTGTYGVVMRRLRARGLVNTSWQGRGVPSSANSNTTSGLHYRSTNNNGGDGTLIEESEYYYISAENDDLPLNLYWVPSTFTFATDLTTDLVLNDFTPRAPISLAFPWE